VGERLPERAMEVMEVVAEQDPPAHRRVEPQVLGELVGLTHLAGVVVPVGAIVSLDEGGVDLGADRGSGECAGEILLSSMHELALGGHHGASGIGLVHRGVGGAAGPALEGLAGATRLPGLWGEDRLAILLQQDVGIGVAVVGSDQRGGAPPVRSAKSLTVWVKVSRSRLPTTREITKRLGTSMAV
jgi:hypothetical protein